MTEKVRLCLFDFFFKIIPSSVQVIIYLQFSTFGTSNNRPNSLRTA